MEPGNDGELEEIGRELRERVGGEFRLAAEEDEYWAMKQARRAGNLREVAYDVMSRGDLIEVQAGHSRFLGHIRHTKNDLATLHGLVNVDVNLDAPIVIQVIEPNATAGISASPAGPGSLAARLAELEQSGELCEFITATPRVEVLGRVRIRARDHITIESPDGREWVIPINWLIAVVNRERLSNQR